MKARLIAAALAAAALLTGCASAQAEQPRDTFRVDPSDVVNVKAVERMRHDADRRHAAQVSEQLALMREAREPDEDVPEPISEAVSTEAEPGYGYSEAYGGSWGGEVTVPYSDAYNADGPTREMPGYHDGNIETYYNASSHFMAGEWTLDDEGFYRDSEGRYVIGVSISLVDEMPYGTVVDTGKGEGVVYDYGYGYDNLHDFATAW